MASSANPSWGSEMHTLLHIIYLLQLFSIPILRSLSCCTQLLSFSAYPYLRVCTLLYVPATVDDDVFGLNTSLQHTHLRMCPASTEQPRRFYPEVTDLLLVSIHDTEAVFLDHRRVLLLEFLYQLTYLINVKCTTIETTFLFFEMFVDFSRKHTFALSPKPRVKATFFFMDSL